MAARKRTKNSRQRGTHTHGWGSKKKHRGAGNRGGRGMAGTGKRGDAKKPSIWKERYFGKYGFKKKNTKGKIHAITLKTVEEKLPVWQKSGLIAEKEGAVTIDLLKIGFNKLLSNGKISRKLKISVPYASAAAVKKVKAAGGEVSGLAGKANASKAKPEKAGEEQKKGVEQG